MSILVADVISRVRDGINDLSGTRIGDDRIRRALSDSLDIAATILPQLFTETNSHNCSVGVFQLLSFERAIRFIEVLGYPHGDFKALDAFRPGWINDDEATIQMWSEDATDPMMFLVYPPSPGGQALSVTYVKAPAEVTTSDTSLSLPDNLLAPLVSYCIGVIESADDEHTNSNRAAQAKAEFVALLKGV